MTQLDLTSWSLIRRAAAGDPADRERFAERYQPVVRAFFCARWKLPYEHEEVADAAQEVFVDCFRQNGALSRADPDYPSGFRSFLYGIARRVAASTERKLARRHEAAASSAIRLDNIERSQVTLSRAFDRAWARNIIFEAGQLALERAKGNDYRIRAQQAMQLRFDEGLPPREIAGQMGEDIEVVYRLLKRAKRDFRTALLEVMAVYDPRATEAELKQKCVDLLAQR